MGTTTLAVELLVIGYQALIWLVLAACLSRICDDALLSVLKDWKEFLVVGSVVAAYTSGAIMNGISAKLVEKFESKWIHKQSLKPSTMRAALLVQKPDAYVHVMKNFDAPRVLRSTIFNVLLIGVFTFIYLYNSTTFTWRQLLLVALAFIIGSGLTAWAWYETAENYAVHLKQTYEALTKNQ